MEYQDTHLRNLPCKHIECDEIWSFCYAKQRNLPKEKQGEYGVGDVWTWVALDSDTKLVASWLVGLRDADYAHEFMLDLQSRLTHRVQLTTDGHHAYWTAVEDAFGSDVDYAQLIKMYGKPDFKEVKYSAGECIGIKKEKIQGHPDMTKVSTSYIERQNLTMRICMRRCTRLINGFSKKMENLNYAVALHFMYYNYVRVHKTLKQTPAMAAGVTDHVWSLEDIVNLTGKNFSASN